jgi:hypothetical protein
VDSLVQIAQSQHAQMIVQNMVSVVMEFVSALMDLLGKVVNCVLYVEQVVSVLTKNMDIATKRNWNASVKKVGKVSIAYTNPIPHVMEPRC